MTLHIHRRRRGTGLRQSRWYSAPPQARDEAQAVQVVLGTAAPQARDEAQVAQVVLGTAAGAGRGSGGPGTRRSAPGISIWED